ncbi:hypothetical protein [Mucilaginibacter myungsuensis]|uniref:Uncharacterized protein n=1 Tax=Mucilaginibacter myungsuensis TaxID=649104 RepID=A0A929L4V1_9SPHI|nr:hypothetical protein [Mucilaginibacter myungsuensis]MBE9664499.1 hypothetical protein [Mucilaginibacter myungsuensis]MDN3601356.1 hypothetical protein [Mucilaginibacter myungsuensis]
MKRIFFLAALVLLTNLGFGQKLPNIQQGGVHAPANVKIDGKTTEWGELKAYNKATQVYYTMANDKQYLYLVLKAQSYVIIDKITKGGVTLTVNPQAKRKDKTLPEITFPMYEKPGPKYFQIIDSKAELTGDATTNKRVGDSLARLKNKTLSEYFKWIGTINLKGISDSLISAYNDEGIKTASAMDSELSYNYELAIPLKSLGLGISSGKFYYNIQLNGVSYYYAGVQEFRPGYFSLIKADGTGVIMNGDRSTHADKIFPTDLWGEYTLAK